MRAFTADVRETLAWFDRTHQVEALGLGAAVWRLTRLPYPGGLAAQPARLMQALDHCRAVSNHLLSRRQAAAQDDDLARWHREDIKTRHRERTH